MHTTHQSGIGNDYTLPLKRESMFLERESQLDSQLQRPLSSLYGQEPPLSGLRPTGLGRNAGALVTQVSFCLLVFDQFFRVGM